MKKLLILFALIPLLASCDLDGMMDDMTRLSPTIKGYSYSSDGQIDLGDADAGKAFTAFIIAKSKWVGKKGDKVDCQVQVMGDKWGGDPDKLEIYYFQKGKLTYESATSCTIKIDGKYSFLDGTWDFVLEENGDKITLTSGTKTMKLKFWHETD